jgi:hypothetical protein
MFEKVFLDTSGWLALLNRADLLHAPADTLWRELGQQGHRVYVTDWVIAETGNGLARTTARLQFVKAVELLRASAFAQIIQVTTKLLERALALYKNRSDKTWGLVDCASFLVMQDEGIVKAFTTDQHFRQAGFTCLLSIP